MLYDALLANVAKNPEYEAVRYKGVISFATNTALWDAWERIFTDLENPKHKEDAEDFFKANEAEMLEGTAVLWEEKLPYYALMVMRVYDFIQSEDDDLVRLEIAQRARLGLQKREVIVPESIEIDVGFSDDTFRLRCSFQFADEEEPRELNVVISAVGVEVITT